MQRNAYMPRYAALADRLRRQIENGDLKPGDKVPSETQLCAENGVSRGTVVRAIEQLVGDGIITRRQGAGSFVARPSLHRRAGRLLGFSESAASAGLRSTHSLVSCREATEDEAREFDIGGRAICLTRIRYLDGLRCAIHRSVIPHGIARSLDAFNGSEPGALGKSNFSLYSAFEKAGLSVWRAQERATARLATADEKSQLELDGPTAVMVVFRRSYDKSGRILEAVEAVYDGRFYTFDMQLVSAAESAGRLQPAGTHIGGQLSNPNQRRN